MGSAEFSRKSGLFSRRAIERLRDGVSWWPAIAVFIATAELLWESSVSAVSKDWLEESGNDHHQQPGDHHGGDLAYLVGHSPEDLITALHSDMDLHRPADAAFNLPTDALASQDSTLWSEIGFSFDHLAAPGKAPQVSADHDPHNYLNHDGSFHFAGGCVADCPINSDDGGSVQHQGSSDDIPAAILAKGSTSVFQFETASNSGISPETPQGSPDGSDLYPSYVSQSGNTSDSGQITFTGNPQVLGANVAGSSVVGSTGDLGNWISGTSSDSKVAYHNPDDAGLVINVVYDASVASAPAGFKTAVQDVVEFYETHFSNPITITIDVGYGEIDGQSLQGDALGESEANLTSVSYAALQNALVTNANAIGDAAAAASLPTASPVDGQYWVTTAEAKALGIAGPSTAVDGYAGFSAIPTLFDYSDSGSIPSYEYDFVGVVAHEFSEIMGRSTMDGTMFDGAPGYEPLDFFHYSAPGVRDFSGTTPGYASPDGGVTNLNNFNTDPNGDFGDWAASAGNDSYDDASFPGTIDPVTPADLSVMNLLGWEPMNVVNASGGNMTVTTTGNAQTMLGAPGDVLVGGTGGDTFYFPENMGHETIQNFDAASDVIEFPQSEFSNFAEVEADMHQVGANTIIELDGHDSLTLSNVALQSLHASNFHFVL